MYCCNLHVLIGLVFCNVLWSDYKEDSEDQIVMDLLNKVNSDKAQLNETVC